MMPTMTAEQQANLTKIQEVTKSIRARVHKGEAGSISITFVAENDEAKAVLPQIQDNLVSSVANVLHMFFNISGEVS